MGLFDYVNYKMKCPICKEIIKDFQTKDMRNNLRVYQPDELPYNTEIHMSCGTCKTRVSILLNREKRKSLKEQIVAARGK